MQDLELLRIYHTECVFREIEAHKRYWAWRKQAVLELQQLRETQRLSGEHLACAAEEKVIWDPAGTGESNISITLKHPTDTSDILPITTPAAFALKQQHASDPRTCFRSGTEEKASPFGRQPPGKRFSFCEM